MRLTLGVVASCILALTGCGGGGGGGGGDGDTDVKLPPGCEAVEAPGAKEVHLARPPRRSSLPSAATVHTSCGDFEIALASSRAPATVSSFAYLAREGVYDDTLIHRIQTNFVIQGGDPKGDGTGGPGYFVDEPPPADLSYTRGTVAMAKSAVEPPGRSGSQFFVVTAADAGLSPDYALVGRVIRGMDVVRRIARLGTPSGVPTAPVLIESVTVEAR
jgi:peptidyl-prolyl cis-trans isomerase B (cyclophilin B)